MSKRTLDIRGSETVDAGGVDFFFFFFFKKKKNAFIHDLNDH